MHPSGRTNQEEVEEGRTRAAAVRQALVLRTQRCGMLVVGRSSERVEDWEGREGRRNLRAAAAAVGCMVGEGQDRADCHTELVPEGGRIRTAESVVVQVDSLVGHIGSEVGGHRMEHLDPGSRS
jgi:hypothetical protein